MDNIRHAIVSVDVVIFFYNENTLKVAVKKVVNKEYLDMQAFPGALIKPEENAKQAIERILVEKVGINSKKVYLEELGSYSDIDRDVRGRVVSIAYICLVNNISDLENLNNVNFIDAKKNIKLAYDHNNILKDAILKLQTRFYNSTIANKLLPGEFTMKDFLDLYNLILNKEIDKRNFAKKIKALDIIKENGGEQRAGKFRPAKLFEFNSKKVVDLEIF